MAVTSTSALQIPLHRLPIPAAALDRTTTIVAANRRFERLCGGTHPSGSGRRFADIVAGSDKTAVDDALSALMLDDIRTPRRRTIRAFSAKDPTMRLAIDVVRLGPDPTTPYLACLHVLSKRRRLETLPKRSPPSPEPRSREHVSSVVQDFRAWPSLLTTLSHEFRGPLTAICGWVHMAQKTALPPATLSRALMVIGRNAASLSDMIDNVFDLSRRAAGSLVLQQQVLDLNPLAELVVDSSLPAARHRNLALTLRRTPAPLLIDGDRFRLEQIVRNLVENAIKFTPEGGRVHVHTGSEGGFAELVVTDNGLGIEPGLLRAIFEPFRHEDARVHPSERGLGLGLALVRELVQLHGGDVRALSGGTGQGSTFIVRLPLANAAA